MPRRITPAAKALEIVRVRMVSHSLSLIHVPDVLRIPPGLLPIVSAIRGRSDDVLAG
jgi:hypothetical protein